MKPGLRRRGSPALLLLLRAMLLGRLGGSSPAHERGLYLSCSPLAITGAGLIQIHSGPFCYHPPRVGRSSVAALCESRPSIHRSAQKYGVLGSLFALVGDAQRIQRYTLWIGNISSSKRPLRAWDVANIVAQ